MKTFTKFFALLFAFTIIGSTSLNAANWWEETVSGDNGAPMMEIWIYGATIGGTPLVDGDYVGAFDGDKLVGIMQIDITAPATEVSDENWIDNKLVVYSKDASGNDLYTPGHPIILKAYHGGSDDYWAYTWGDGEQIDFHNTWYATHGDDVTDVEFDNIGAFFPNEGENGYCYVALDFTTDDVTYDFTLRFNVFNTDDDGINDITISSGGYTGTTAGGTAAVGVTPGDPGTIDIPVFVPSTGSVDYLFKLEDDNEIYDTEWYTVNVTAGSTGTLVLANFVLGLYGSVSGIVEYNDPVDGLTLAEGAVVTVSFGDSTYTATTDADGAYSISGIPDGAWPITAWYPDYQLDESDLVVASGALTPTYSPDLDPLEGTLSGEIFDATTLQLIKDEGVTVTLVGTGVSATSDVNGEYTLTHTAGTYDLTVAHAGYETITLEDYVLAPDVTTEQNFNMLPDPFTDYPYSEVTGNPNKMWSIHITHAKFGSNSLLPYDQIAIFDTDAGEVGSGSEVLVGVLTLDYAATWQNSGVNVLKAYAQFSNGDPGFAEGHSIDFRGYDVSHGNGDPTGEPLSWLFTPNMGTYEGTTFPDPDENHVSYLEINWDFPSGSVIGVVENDVSAKLENVTVTALNVFTDEEVGTATTNADGEFVLGLDQGTYNIKFSLADYATYTEEDVVITLGQVTDLGTIELAARDWVTNATYNWTAQGYYFIGRALEVADNDMMTLLNGNNTAVSPIVYFEGDMTASWVEDDQTNKLEYVVDNGSGNPGWIPNLGGAPNNYEIDYDWELLKGYQLYAEKSYATTWTGDSYLVEPEDNPIDFSSAGIYYVPYFPWDDAQQDEAIVAFASILESIDWVMDSRGNRLHKDNGGWIDNIGTMSYLEGYKVKVNESVTLTYPAAATTKSPSGVMLDPVHFVYNEGNAADWTYTMFINTDDFEIGDEIAAYSNGVMVGSMVIDSEEAWENDLPTFFKAVTAGYELGSDIELMGWDASNGNEYNVVFEMVPEVDDAYMGTKYPAGLDHFSYVNVYRGTVRVDENQINNDVKVYPNPTSNMLTIESVSNINELHVYNIYGALIDVVNVNSKQQSIDVSNYSTGTYMLQLHTDTGVITKRVVVK